MNTIFSLEVTPGDPYILENLLGHRWEISGVVGVLGAKREVVAIRLHHVLVDKLLEKSGVVVSWHRYIGANGRSRRKPPARVAQDPSGDRHPVSYSLGELRSPSLL